MYIHCKQSKNDGVIWFIEAEIEMTLDGRFIKSTTKRGEFKFSTNAPFSHGFRKFISWNKCVYRIGDSFNAKVSVKIRKAIGNCKSVLRSFDKSNEIGLEVLIETYWAEYYVMREVLGFFWFFYSNFYQFSGANYSICIFYGSSQRSWDFESEARWRRSYRISESSGGSARNACH